MNLYPREVAEEIAPSQEEPKRKVSFEDGTAQVFDSAVAPRKIHEGSTETVPVPPETDEENQKSSENQGKELLSFSLFDLLVCIN